MWNLHYFFAVVCHRNDSLFFFSDLEAVQSGIRLPSPWRPFQALTPHPPVPQ